MPKVDTKQRFSPKIGKIIRSFSRKPHNSLAKRHFKEIHRFIRILHQTCCIFLILQNFIFFSRKPQHFSTINPIFVHFQKPYYFVRILRQICSSLVKKFQNLANSKHLKHLMHHGMASKCHKMHA